MLILTRKSDESIIIGGNVEVKILKITPTQVHLGIIAPKSVSIYRNEVFEQVVNENQAAMQSSTMLKGLQTLSGHMRSKPGQDDAQAPK